MINEATSLNMSISARYARKYGTKNSGSTAAVSGSHTSRILGTKSKIKMNELTADQKTSSVNALEASCYASFEESTPRNYRIKIKRPKSAFFASASSSSSSSSTVSSNTSKPSHSPSPPPVVLRSNEIIINPKSASKKAATSRHYFYTKEEIADYNDHVALNQLFMSKTCQSLANGDLSVKPKTHRSANSTNKATFFSRPR